MTDLIQYKVVGLVQGVSFRYATQKEASKLGLRGWVRNSPDDSVEGVAVGSTQQLDSFRSFLSKGPSAAKVENVEYKKDVKGASDNDIKSVLGDNISGYEMHSNPQCDPGLELKWTPSFDETVRDTSLTSPVNDLHSQAMPRTPITGIVQFTLKGAFGPGYREGVRKKAESFYIKGWILWLPGSTDVLVGIAVGEPHHLREFAECLEHNEIPSGQVSDMDCFRWDEDISDQEEARHLRGVVGFDLR